MGSTKRKFHSRRNASKPLSEPESRVQEKELDSWNEPCNWSFVKPTHPLFVLILCLTSLCPGLFASEFVAEEFESSSRFLAGFEEKTKSGLFRQITADGKITTLDRKAGFTLQEIHPLTLDGAQAVLLIWKNFPSQTKTSPELWVDGPVIEGFEELPTLERVWPLEEEDLIWTKARHELQVRKGVARLNVLRSLAEENEAAPLLKKKEAYRLSKDGVQLEKAQSQAISNLEQRLNRMADNLSLQNLKAVARDWEAFKNCNSQSHLERATILMSYLPMKKAHWMQVRQVLDTIVTEGGSNAERAATRLFEMIHSEWEVGAR